jgi:RND family efflux transporter MFP subunit
MKRRMWMIAVVAVVAACSRKPAPEKAEAASAPPVKVTARTVKLEPRPSWYEATGTVNAVTTSAIASKVMGTVLDVRVRVGDRVRAGQVLAVIDARDLESSLAQAKAGEQEARSAVAEADNGVAAAKAQLDLARSTFQRMDALFKKTSISNQEFDEARARLASAEAAYRMAVSKREQLDSRIAQARQQVESASVVRGYSEIRSPFAGVVTDRKVEPGQMATPGAPLLTVERGGAYRLEAAVEEAMLRQLRLGQRVAVRLDALDQTLNGTVQEIAPTVDPGSRTVLVKVQLPAAPLVRSGLFGKLRLPSESRSALMIPEGALLDRNGSQTVLVVENGLARSRAVTTGDRVDGRVEVLSGLMEGDRVIAPRPAALADGARVESQS